MMNKKNKTKMDKIFVSTLITLTGFSATTMAKTVQRKSSLPQHMMNKVIKKQFQSDKKKQEKKKIRLSFDPSVLTSEYSSWGVEPSNRTSSINLVPAWKTFRKKKDIVVAVIDTGIAHKKPGLGIVGFGIVYPPKECFEKALHAFISKYKNINSINK